MPDENITDTTATVAATIDQPASPPAESKPAPAFTQEDVNRIVAQRLADDRARRPAQAPAPKSAPTAPAAAPDLASELAAIKQQLADQATRLDFEKRTKGLDVDAAKSETLFKVFAANPTAFDEVVQAFGIKPVTQPAAQAAPPTTPEAPRPAMAPSAPAGNALPTQNGVIDLFSLTPEQLRSLGPQGVRGELEKLWKIGSQLSGAPARPKVPSRT